MDLNLPLRSNAGFLEGRKLLNERQYDIAIDVFSRLAESCLAANGEDSIEHAVACMEYGIALLEKEQDQPSDTLMTGNVAKSNPEDIIIDDNDDEDEEDSEEDNVEQGGEEGAAPGNAIEEPENDLQLAWEVLDLSRKVFEVINDHSSNKLLAQVYSRLGDILMHNNFYQGAVDEFGKSLEKAKQHYDAYSNHISEAFYNIAVAHIYNAAEEGVDAAKEKRLALDNYTKSRDVIKMWLEQPSNKPLADDQTSSSSSSSSSSSWALASATPAALHNSIYADKKLTCEEIDETIASLQNELKEMTSHSSSSSSGSVTTIGFGVAPAISSSSVASYGSSSSSSAFPLSTAQSVNTSLFSFGGSSAASSSLTLNPLTDAISAPAVAEAKDLPLMQIKKKAKVFHDENKSVNDINPIDLSTAPDTSM